MTELLSPVGLTYDLEGHVFNVVDDLGVEWPADIAGWDETPPPIGDTVPRPNDDGADFSDLYLGPKPMTINGAAICPDQAAAYRARDQLLGASRLLRRTGVLLVNEPIPKRVEVRTGGSVAISWVDDKVFQFAVPLIAADPLRYGSELVALSVALRSSQAHYRTYPKLYDGGLRYRETETGIGGTASIVNDGVAATYPTFSIQGPVTNPTVELEGAGQFLTFTTTLTASDRLVVDTATRSVQLNGTPSRWILTDGSFFRLPPGESAIVFRAFDFNSTARLTVEYRSAWL